MKVIIALLFALVISTQAGHVSLAQVKKIDALRNNRDTWASVLLNLAEIQMLAQGPIDDLIEALHNTQEDLGNKLVKANEAFDKRTQEHDAEVHRLEAIIADLEARIEDVETTLNMLAGQKAQLEESNRVERIRIDTLNEQIEKATNNRAAQHQEFEETMIALNEDLEVLDQCIGMLDGLMNDDVSLVQINQAQTLFGKISKHFNERSMPDIDMAFVQSLTQLATSDYADHSALQKVVDMFNEVRQKCVDKIGELSEKENKAQADFEAFLAKSKQQIVDSGYLIDDNNSNLELNAATTEANNIQLGLLHNDLNVAQQELQDENDAYIEATARYEDLVTEFHAELDACADALEVVENADFADYIEDRVQANGPMDVTDQHGAGTEVFNFGF